MAKSPCPLAIGIALCALASTQAHAVSSFETQVVAVVPTICNVAHHGQATNVGDSFELGQLTEYCNAPSGFSLFVEYTPGTLVGTQLTVDSKTIQLDGSGRAEITQHEGPTIVTTDISVTPGQNGFDSGFLTFAVDPH